MFTILLTLVRLKGIKISIFFEISDKRSTIKDKTGKIYVYIYIYAGVCMGYIVNAMHECRRMRDFVR